MQTFYSRKGIEYKDKFRADQEPSQKIKNRARINLQAVLSAIKSTNKTFYQSISHNFAFKRLKYILKIRTYHNNDYK